MSAVGKAAASADRSKTNPSAIHVAREWCGSNSHNVKASSVVLGVYLGREALPLSSLGAKVMLCICGAQYVCVFTKTYPCAAMLRVERFTIPSKCILFDTL